MKTKPNYSVLEKVYRYVNDEKEERIILQEKMIETTKATLTNFAASYPLARKLINMTSLLTLVLFISSLFAPLFTLETFYFFSNTVSLLSALLSLLEKGHLVGPRRGQQRAPVGYTGRHLQGKDGSEVRAEPAP